MSCAFPSYSKFLIGPYPHLEFPGVCGAFFWLLLEFDFVAIEVPPPVPLKVPLYGMSESYTITLPWLTKLGSSDSASIIKLLNFI